MSRDRVLTLAVHHDLTIDDPEELQHLQKLRQEAPVENLAARFQHYASQNLLLTEQRFGFVRQLVKRGFTVIGIRELGLAYTVGLWYSYSYPELMLVSNSAQASMQAMNGALQDTAEELWKEEPVETEVWQRDPRGFLEPRAHKLGQLAFQALRRHGLKTDAFHNADPNFLKNYPYGYGFHFYQKFADELDIPILKAEIV